MASAARDKQLLLECLLQGPRHSWLRYLDGRQALRAGILLHLRKLRLIRKSRQRV
jgi:hypothetical protein